MWSFCNTVQLETCVFPLIITSVVREYSVCSVCSERAVKQQGLHFDISNCTNSNTCSEAERQLCVHSSSSSVLLSCKLLRPVTHANLLYNLTAVHTVAWRTCFRKECLHSSGYLCMEMILLFYSQKCEDILSLGIASLYALHYTYPPHEIQCCL